MMKVLPMSLAIWYPYVGKLGALLAAFATMLVVYLLPLSTFIKAAIVEKRSNNTISENNGSNKDIEHNDDFIL